MEERINLIRPGYFSVQAAADSRRWEFDIQNETILEHKLHVDFVFIGDSITHFWDLNIYFGKSGKLIFNRGISGDMTEFLLRRFEADVVQLKPKHAILKIGINNTWIMDDYIGNKKAVENLKNSMFKNIKAAVELGVNSNIKMIVCSMLPTNLPAKTNNRERNELVVELNKQLKTLTEEKNLIYVDYHSKMTAEDGITLRNGLADDGLHPHVKGYDVMAKILRETLVQYDIQI
jgi:lysophospholipase L1-like esterase